MYVCMREGESIDRKPTILEPQSRPGAVLTQAVIIVIILSCLPHG